MSWTDDEPVESQINEKELVEMVLLNKDRKVRIKVELKDTHGESVPLKKVVTDLLEYVDDKFKEGQEENPFVSQIYPLLANMLATTLGKALHPNLAAAVLTNNLVKDSFMMTMSLSFLLLQYIKQNGYSIHSTEEPLTDEQIESWNTRALISSVAGKAAMLGIDFKTAIATVYKHGNITLEQASLALGYNVTEDELQYMAGGNLDEEPEDEDKEPNTN